MAITQTPTQQPPGPAITLGQKMYRTGSGLLGKPIAGNGVGQVQMPKSFGFDSNPYLGGMANDISNRTNTMLDQKFLEAQSGAVAAGGMGGSRQGVAEGIAAGNAADFLQGNLAKMYGNAYEGQQDRNLQQYQGDQQYYTAQRGQDLMGATAGAGLVNQGLQTQWQPLQNAGDLYAKFQGNGTTTTGTSSGGGWQGAVGGLLSGAAMGKQMGWWG